MFTAATLDRFADEAEMDLRTWDEIDAQDEADAAAVRETLTGLPSRPGVIR